MRSWSGPMPSIGEMAPPSTWNSPVNSCADSIVCTSCGCSTTQITDLSRSVFEQIGHGSCSVHAPHIEHGLILSCSDARRCANCCTYARSSLKNRMCRDRKFDLQMRKRIFSFLLNEEWSPAQISGYLRRKGEPYVSAATIYQYIS